MTQVYRKPDNKKAHFTLKYKRFFLPGNADAEAQLAANRLVEQGVHSLPGYILSYQQEVLSQYRDMRGPVVETDEHPSVEACARSIIDRIKSGCIA
ncbi:MAG: hypothetical protein ABII68_06540 [Pseudomonadota bacterium]